METFSCCSSKYFFTTASSCLRLELPHPFAFQLHFFSFSCPHHLEFWYWSMWVTNKYRFKNLAFNYLFKKMYSGKNTQREAYPLSELLSERAARGPCSAVGLEGSFLSTDTACPARSPWQQYVLRDRPPSSLALKVGKQQALRVQGVGILRRPQTPGHTRVCLGPVCKFKTSCSRVAPSQYCDVLLAD